MANKLAELLSSSSSSSSSPSETSSSSEDMELLLSFSSDDSFIDNYLENNIVSPPKRLKRTRVKDFYQEVIEKYTEQEFRMHFRVSRATSEVIIAEFAESEYFNSRNYSGGRKSISARIQILAFLWFAGNRCTYREVGNLFDIGISTVYRIFSNILDFFFYKSNLVIKFPTTPDEKNEVASNFEKISGFPNVIGCMDGCYIYARKPARKIKSTYINRHDLVSITMQGICDANKKFIDVFVGPPSKMHDARVFEISDIREKIADICGDSVMQHIQFANIC